MVASKTGKHLQLYMAAKAEVMSILWVTKRPKPKHPQALRGALVAGSGSKDPDPKEGPHDQEAFGFEIPKPA
jgi:hypothetical protein